MKVNIVFPFKHGPWGGGNQFLKALRAEFRSLDLYVDDPEDADIILFNSHHDLDEVLRLKRHFPSKKFIHRIDGPVFFIRGGGLKIDKLIFAFAQEIADFSIFQSEWSLKKCLELGAKVDNSSIVYNAPDVTIFNHLVGKRSLDSNKKIKLIATSWSDNFKKGFDIYKFLDDNLDYSRYDFTFVGNSPIEFRNVRHLLPMDSDQLADELRMHDIYITASENDPCSNSLIEALACGLPSLVLNDGGHPELIGDGGRVFNGREDVISVLDEVVESYSVLHSNLPSYTIQRAASEYIEAFSSAQKIPSSQLNLSRYAYLSLRRLFALKV